MSVNLLFLDFTDVVSRCGSTVVESVASRSHYSLPTIAEVGERLVAGFLSVGGFSEFGTLGCFGPAGSPRTGS